MIIVCLADYLERGFTKLLHGFKMNVQFPKVRASSNPKNIQRTEGNIYGKPQPF